MKTCPDCGCRVYEYGCVNCNEVAYINAQEGNVSIENDPEAGNQGAPYEKLQRQTEALADRDDYRAAYEDAKRLARELDVALHGEAGAARQASLCDLLGPARKLRELAEELRQRVETLRRERDGEVWMWQSYGDNFPESLTCPVLMTADQLRDLLPRPDVRACIETILAPAINMKAPYARCLLDEIMRVIAPRAAVK